MWLLHMILGCDSAKSKSVPTSRGPFFIRTTVFKMYPRGVCVSQVRRAAFQSILQDQAHGDGLADSRVRGNGGPTILGVALSGGGQRGLGSLLCLHGTLLWSKAQTLPSFLPNVAQDWWPCVLFVWPTLDVLLPGSWTLASWCLCLSLRELTVNKVKEYAPLPCPGSHERGICVRRLCSVARYLLCSTRLLSPLRMTHTS